MLKIIKTEKNQENENSNNSTTENEKMEIEIVKSDENIVSAGIALDNSKDIEISKKINNTAAYVYALGGLGEVGKNMYVVEQENEIWIIDSGIKFTSEIFSIEGIIPSFEHLEKNSSKIKGLIITHGHEDHIGAIPHLLNSIDITKIYSGRMTSNQIWAKLKENNLEKRPKIEIINNSSKIRSKHFTFEFFNVNHSIPDSFGIIIRNKNGIIVSTGDFKFDLTPVGSRSDFSKMAAIGDEGVTLLLSDSTNAHVGTWSLSERFVSKNLDNLLYRLKGRIIVATFASNVYRVREIINIAIKYRRKIVIFGWSMEKTIKIARKIKYINTNDELFITPKEAKNYDDDQLIILCTGTQGEPMAALSKMANRNHPDIKVKSSDNIIFASSAIPGNWLEVEKVINNLIKMKANVITSKTNPGIHASGHGGKLEQLLMLSLIRPRYFFPIHGETAMLKEHVRTAEEAKIKEKNSFVLKNGEKLKIENEIVIKTGNAIARDIFIDGTNLNGQSLKVVTDRKKMSENGFIGITIGIDSKKNEIIFDPTINTKGMFDEKLFRKQITAIEVKIKEDILKYLKHSKKITFSGIKEIIRVTTENEIYKINKLKPIVAPIILNIGSPLIVEKENIVENEIQPSLIV